MKFPPKETKGKMRPLGISCYEDKLVENAIAQETGTLICEMTPEIIELWGLNVQIQVKSKKLRPTDREIRRIWIDSDVS